VIYCSGQTIEAQWGIKKMPKWWWILGYIWSLPHTVVGLILSLFYRPTNWRWNEGCIEAIGEDRIWFKPGAQTHGWLILYRDESARNNKRLRVHERTHVKQGFLLGPLYVIAYVIHFLYRYTRTGFKDWYTAYEGIYFEKKAREAEQRYLDGVDKEPWGSKG